MGRWQRVVLGALMLGLGVPVGGVAQAAERVEPVALARDLADMLVILSGTAAVVDSPRIQQALQDPQPLLNTSSRRLDVPKVQQLLKDAGFRVWKTRPRLWVVSPQSETALTVFGTESRFEAEAQARGLPYSTVRATETDAAAVSALLKGSESSTLQDLLASHEADALVVVSGTDWFFLQPGRRLDGTVEAGSEQPALLPHVLSEALAARFQWPEAYDRPLIRVQGVNHLKDFAEAQAALQQLKGLSGVSLVRLEGNTAWFAVDAPAGRALASLLDAEPRLPAASSATVLKPLVQRARSEGSPVQNRAWAPPATAAP